MLYLGIDQHGNQLTVDLELLWTNRQRIMGQKRPAGLRRLRICSPQEAEDRQISALRKHLKQSRARTINKVHHILLKHKPIKRRRGTSIARVAVVRHLMTVIHSMLKHDMPYVTGGSEAFRRALAFRDAAAAGAPWRTPAALTSQ